MTIRKRVKKFPYPIKQFFKCIYGTLPSRIRLGNTFWKTYEFLDNSQWWERKKLESYQMKQLEKILKHAYEKVPYYREIFNARGLKPKSIQDFDDLKKLPYLTKDSFRNNYENLLSEDAELKNLYQQSTSGTTGKPLQFYEHRDTYLKELAFIYHQWSRAGVRPKDKIIQLRGAVIKGKNPTEYNPETKILRFSPLIPDQEVVQMYLKKMKDYNACFLHGYPSLISLYARKIKKYGIRIPFKLKAILFASESTYPWQREVTEEVFNCKVFSHYGLAEKVALGSECEKNKKYHFMPQYSFVEIDKENNEIIGTNFLNYANPFIRYKTTDTASGHIFSNCGKCGRDYYPVLSNIGGRLGDFIITPEGMYISPIIFTHPLKEMKEIKNVQIIQERKDYIKLKIVPWENAILSELTQEAGKIIKEFRVFIGEKIEIEPAIVDSIENSNDRKYKWVISNLKDLENQ